MASRMEQKQQARAARRAAAEVAVAAASRRRRMRTFGAIIAIAVTAVVVTVMVSSGRATPSGPLSKAQAARAYRSVEHVLTGIPQHGERLGRADAKVTMTYVGDLECPYCRYFTLHVLPQFLSADVRTGKVKVVYRSLCTATCHFNTRRFVPQQVAAYAAGRQNLFWQYAELFYREQEDETLPYVTEHYLRNLARQIPSLNVTRWLSERSDPALGSQVQDDQREINRLRVPEQTPEVLMSGPRGTTYLPAQGAPTLAWLSQAVAEVS